MTNTNKTEADYIAEEADTPLYEVFKLQVQHIYDAEKQEPYMLEINTVPGQSAASIVPQQVLAMNSTLKEFYTSLIEECLG